VTSGHWQAPLCIGTQLCSTVEVAAIALNLAEAGYKGLELHPLQLASMGDRVYRRSVVEAFRSAGLQVACVFAGVASDAPSVALASARCEMAAELGADLVFLVPPSKCTGTLEEAAAQVRKVCSRAGEFGLKVALHNHAGTHVTTVAAQRRFLEAVDRDELGLCLDIAHLALFEDDVPSAIERLASHIIYLHVKDLEAGTREKLEGLNGDSLEGVAPLTPAYTDLGAGALDVSSALDVLAQHGYVGWATVEIETLRRNRFIDQARANAAAFNSLVALSPEKEVKP
jgi:sugar phosphate isomerase/epimerase